MSEEVVVCFGGHEVGHLERGAGDGCERKVDGDHVIKTQWLSVRDERFENGRLKAGIAPLGERVADVRKKRDAGLFEVGEIVAVVHNPHGVGFDEAHPNLVSELIVGR